MYDIDKEFLRKLEEYAYQTEKNKVTEMIESKLTKAVLVSGLEILFSNMQIKEGKIDIFAEKLIKHCKDNDIPVVKGIVLLSESFTDFAELVTGDNDE